MEILQCLSRDTARKVKGLEITSNEAQFILSFCSEQLRSVCHVTGAVKYAGDSERSLSS